MGEQSASEERTLSFYTASRKGLSLEQKQARLKFQSRRSEFPTRDRALVRGSLEIVSLA